MQWACSGGHSAARGKYQAPSECEGHVDGTCGADGEIVFTAKEGRTGMTINAGSVPTGKEDYIRPLLEWLRDTAGLPAAITRDMGEAIKKDATAVFSNMWNTHYAAALSEMDFAGEMCSVTGREMAEARKLIRPSPRVPIVRNDGDRGTLLHKFVEIIEKHDTGMEGHMKRWVSAVKT